MSKRVLLIDYEPRSVERLQALLSSEYQVVVARDGEEGLATFSGPDRFDAILLAGMLPRLASGEVIREIRRKGGATAPPILLMVTGYKGSNPKADAQRVGAFDILVKPFSDDDLRTAMGGAIAASDIGSKTMRIPTVGGGAPLSELTASDIFSDVLKDVASEAPARKPAAAPPAPVAAPAAPAPPASRPAPSADAELDQRLKDTLSGMLAARPTVKTPAAASDKPAPPRKPATGSSDIDRMISDTLSGLQTPLRPRPPADRTPAPAVPAAPAKAVPAATRAEAPRPAPGAAAPAEPPRVAEGPPVSMSGPDRFGQYEILERIASGGMAELYRARRSGVEGFQKIVAIKKILPHLADNEGFIAMFADEAKLAAQLNHPNIVHIYDLGKIEGGGYFIAMEHVEGRDLRAILESARELQMPLPVPLAVYIASKVASALDYAHRRRDEDGRDLHIVHRDVSPQNILISYEGDIKLCDFGIAKAASKVSQTESGALKGKIQYMSPEQAWGKPIDRRSDLFSLGTVLYELLTEQRLFGGDSDMTVLEKVRAAVVPAPSEANSEVPKPLDTIVAKSLARDADDRYANASDMLRDLESVLYSYTPAPGSADLAIFLHRLQAEETAVAEAKAREAARAVPEAEVEQKPRRAKAAPVARRTGSVPAATPPPPAAPEPPPPAARPAAAAPRESTAPGVFGSYAERAGEGESRRTALYATIGIAVVALLGGGYWMLSRKPSVKPVPRPAATAAPATPAPATPVPTAAAPAIDPRKVDEEVQRQVAQKKKEMQKALDAERKQAARDASAAAPATAAEPAPAETRESAAAAPPPAAVRAEPTEAPTEPPPPTAIPTRPAPAPAPEPELKRGDLVGPGPGVIEPEMTTKLKVEYPPIARQQGSAGGRVVVLVLVDEDGRVSETRLQQGVASRGGINEAVIAAVKKAAFKPATKFGIAVKMWRPVVVDVKP